MMVYVSTHEDKARIAEHIMNTPGGLSVDVTKGKRKKKTHDQDRLENLWHREAAEQLGDETPEQKRGFCKLHFGVPIMRSEDDDFRRAYDRVIRPLPYELKLQAMTVPLDFPVTRLMKTGQKKRYLDDVWSHYTSKGVELTNPDSEHEEQVYDR